MIVGVTYQFHDFLTALGDWVDEDDESRVLAQVLAQSQREYYDALTRPKSTDESSATCSKYASGFD